MPRLKAFEAAAPTLTAGQALAAASAPAPAEGWPAPAVPEASHEAAPVLVPETSVLSTPSSLADGAAVGAAPAAGSTSCASPAEKLKESCSDNESAWAQSCLDFELQLGSSEAKRTLKRPFQSTSPSSVNKSCDKISKDKTMDKKNVSSASNNFSKHDSQISKGRKTALFKVDPSCKERTQAKFPTKSSPKRTVRSVNDSEDSDSSTASEESAVSSDNISRSIVNEKPLRRTVQTRSTNRKSNVREVRTRNQSNEEIETKSPVKTRSSLLKETSPDKNVPQESRLGKLTRKHKTSEKSEDTNETDASCTENDISQNVTKAETLSIKIRLRTKVVEVERAHCLRPKGDGSDFRPGWEEEVFQYKRSLRMPQVLINMSKGSAHSEGDYSKPPSVCSVSESAVETSTKPCSRPNSEVDASSNCPDAESEDALSSGSLSASMISRRCMKKRSIVDHLVKKVSLVSASKSKSDGFKGNLNQVAKTLKPVGAVDRLKTKQPNTIIKNTQTLHQDTRLNAVSPKKKDEDSIRAVFGAVKIPSKSRANVSEENKKSKSKTLPSKKRLESIPTRQISLRKRNLVIPKLTNKRNLRTGDAHIEGIVLRPRNAQQVSTSRSGLRSAALIRRSKVVLNIKQRKNRNSAELQSVDVDLKSTLNDAGDLSKTSSVSQTTVVKKRVRLRRKFRSGFDYIRKKKKVKKDDVKKVSVQKAAPVVDRKPLTEEQIQATLRNWVINRSHGDTVLHRAARLGFPEVAQYAIEKLKMSPCVADNAGYTPLHEAARRGHIELSKILLENGADVSCSAKGGVRPLHEAAESNQAEMLRLLLEYGADPSLATYADETPLSIVEPDSAAHQLLTLHLADVQGLPAPPWKYHGPSKLFDEFTYNGDIALQSPPSVNSDADSEINVFSSEVTPPPLYTFLGESPSQLWVLSKDLMKVLNISSEEELLCRLTSVEPNSSQNTPTQMREISVDEFLERTNAVTCCASLSNLPLSGCTTQLLEYSSNVRMLLNEEITTLE